MDEGKLGSNVDVQKGPWPLTHRATRADTFAERQGNLVSTFQSSVQFDRARGQPVSVNGDTPDQKSPHTRVCSESRFSTSVFKPALRCPSWARIMNTGDQAKSALLWSVKDSEHTGHTRMIPLLVRRSRSAIFVFILERLSVFSPSGQSKVVLQDGNMSSVDCVLPEVRALSYVRSVLPSDLRVAFRSSPYRRAESQYFRLRQTTPALSVGPE